MVIRMIYGLRPVTKQISQDKEHITNPDTHSDSVRTRPARHQHQHTDCIYSHHTELHECYNKKIILALLL